MPTLFTPLLSTPHRLFVVGVGSGSFTLSNHTALAGAKDEVFQCPVISKLPAISLKCANIRETIDLKHQILFFLEMWLRDSTTSSFSKRSTSRRNGQTLTEGVVAFDPRLVPLRVRTCVRGRVQITINRYILMVVVDLFCVVARHTSRTRSMYEELGWIGLR